MARIIQNIVLDSKLGNVWEFITNPKNFPKYVYGYINGKTTSANRTGVGASYEWYGKLGPFKIKSIEEIVEWQEKKRVAYTGKLFGIKFNSSMDVKDMANKILLTISIEYKVPLYLGGRIIDLFLIRLIIKDYIQKSLGNLKRIYKNKRSFA